MDNFTFYSPTYFVFGKQTENKAGAYVKKFGGNRVLIHYGRGSVVKSGLLDRVKASLEKEGLSYSELGGVCPNPKSGLVYTGIDICRSQNIDFILAVGGGSVIDSAKLIAAGVLYDGDFLDFCKEKPVERALPVGTVLTIPAAGSEGSPNAVITDETTLVKKGARGDAIRPAFSILNPELCFTLPPFQQAAGISDIIAHVLERYFTPTENVEATDRLCEAVLLTVIKEAPAIMKNPRDYEAQANLMWAGMLAHNNVCGVGRIQDWASHNMGHELSSLYNTVHGASLSVMFPAWMKYVMDVDVSRFVRLAVNVWSCSPNGQNPKQTALEGIVRYESFLKSLGLPTSLKELGVKTEDIPKLVEHLKISRPEGCGGFKRLSFEDAEAIYLLADRETL